MKLLIEQGVLYINNRNLCFAEPGNGRANLLAGIGSVRMEFSHVLGRALPFSDTHGWIGADRECDIVLGQLRSRNGLITSQPVLDVLVAKIVEAEDTGLAVTLEVRK